MTRAVLFDLGSTLWDDYPAELCYWQELVSLLARYGVETTLTDLIALAERMIATYCPSLTRAMVFQLTGGRPDVYRSVIDESARGILRRFKDPSEFRRLNPLFPGVHDLLEALARLYPLGVVSQNFAEARQWMKYHDLDKYFSSVSLSDTERLYKPDPRLFLRACASMGVETDEAVMVGDRLDNDIWPANRLRMTTVRVLADPYRIQQPRYHGDVPQFTIERTGDLLNAVPL
jgi:HAD superfamily hydrolase (TIGR01549 family)